MLFNTFWKFWSFCLFMMLDLEPQLFEVHWKKFRQNYPVDVSQDQLQLAVLIARFDNTGEISILARQLCTIYGLNLLSNGSFLASVKNNPHQEQ
ncbi:Ribulose bisphosphate carboxylase small chain [Frankliniella fusca]|uniref:Ribulose bisphosphate carboxylase small chain n=1 Tax=Frankliniella fusca TaxID=407009 RepID=A0AAE1HRZ6_9NEOP|nr:Ribulose bisphosphate carboxylase small chain [Frankliniella fusca]